MEWLPPPDNGIEDAAGSKNPVLDWYIQRTQERHLDWHDEQVRVYAIRLYKRHSVAASGVAAAIAFAGGFVAFGGG